MSMLNKLSSGILLFVLFVISIIMLILGINVSSADIKSYFFNLSAGFVSSMVFYLIVVVYKEYQEKRAITKFIYNRIRNIEHRAQGIIQNGLINGYFAKSQQQYNINNISADEIKLICDSLNFDDKIPNTINVIGQPITQYTNCVTNFAKIKDEIKELISFMAAYLDVKLMAYLSEIFEGNYVLLWPMPQMIASQNPSLSCMSPALYDLLLWSNKVRLHNEKYYKSR